MIQAGLHVSKANIYIMGLTFKENVPDMRNSKAVDVFKYLSSFGLHVKVADPFIDANELHTELNAELVDLRDVKDADCLVFLVAHRQFAELQLPDFDRMFKPQDGSTQPVLIDVKNIFVQKTMEDHGYSYWSL